MNTDWLDFKRCKEWTSTLTDLEVETISVISEEKRLDIEPKLTEVSVHLAALEKIDVSKDKIGKKKRRVMRKNVHVPARNMIEWEPEDHSGD